MSAGGSRASMPPGRPEAEAFRIVEARNPSELSVAKVLIEEYAASLEIDLSFQDFREELERFPGEYAPPHGAVLLATESGEPAGVGAVRDHGPRTCEMKRLYVRPAFRGRGLGRALSERLIRKARELGYARMRLDTLATMDAAIGLYLALGFREIPPYRFNPVPGARYFELALVGG